MYHQSRFKKQKKSEYVNLTALESIYNNYSQNRIIKCKSSHSSNLLDDIEDFFVLVEP
jgi:hypothetical protein